MNTSPKRTADPDGRRPERPSTVDLTIARQMLPLIRSIVNEIVDTRQSLGQLEQERKRLETERRKLEWKDRDRRYAIGDELAQAERNIGTAVKELEGLGLRLIDADSGEIDIPTRINGRQAAFSWRLGEEGLSFWHYEEEEARRPIPSDWQSGTPLRLRANP